MNEKNAIAHFDLRRDDLTKFRPSLFGIMGQGPNLWQNKEKDFIIKSPFFAQNYVAYVAY